MGDVKVASVAPAVAPMAAAAASAPASMSSVAPVAVGAAAPVAASEAAQEREREAVEPVKLEVKTEAAKTTMENKELVAGEPKQETAQEEEAVVSVDEAQLHAQCNGEVRETMENGSREQQEGEDEAEDEARLPTEDATASGTGDTESDGVAVAPVSPALLSRRRPRSPSTRRTESTATVAEQQRDAKEIQKEEEELAAITSVEEQSPEVICLDGDTQEEDEDEDGGDTVGSELSAVDETAETLNAQQTPSRRKRKRAKGQGFSSRKNRDARPRRHGVALSVDATADDAVVAAPPTRARRQRSGDVAADSATATEAAAAAAPTSSEVVTWDWNSCSVYFDPLTQSSMDELSAVRRENAQIVAANGHLWSKMRRFDNDETYMAGMIADAGVDEDLDRLRFRPVARGRAFRDAWEEEDFLLRQRKPAAVGRGASKKRPFAGCDVISSYRKLVRGFDDDLFDKYLQQLEANAKRKAETERDEPNGGASQERLETSPPRRLKSAKRPAKDLDTLPCVPSSKLHPAACGSWKLKGKEAPSFDSIHPASIRSAFVPQRWVEEMLQTTETVDDSSEKPRRSGRRDANKQGEGEGDTDEGDEAKADAVAVEDHSPDEVIELPSFGLVVDEDEVSRVIDNSILRLLELSALNWRRAQAVYERAAAHIEVTPLLLGEEAIKSRLESLYRKIYPPVPGDQDDLDDAPPREWQLMSKPKDIVAYAVKPCDDMNEAMAVGASVEYAVRLKKGDAIDVLDRNGCWNDGVVIGVFEEAGVGLKYIQVSYALWGDASSEWVSVADGRVLPRGVADGRSTFKVAPSSIRKKRIELNKALADLLQRTYPSRLAARAHLGAGKEESAKQLSKKQRRQR